MRRLEPADTASVIELVRPHPVRGVLIEYVTRLGLIGRIPGFFGCFAGEALRGVSMVGALGGTFIEAESAEVCRELGRAAASLSPGPRHVIGAEDLTVPFWEAFRPRASAELLWERREIVYVVRRPSEPARSAPVVGLRPARLADGDQLVRNSARQHLEDLKEDRYAMEPEGFRQRHLSEIREGHWWVLEEGGFVRFQVHVGPRNREVVQLGGVFTPETDRGRGYATCAMRGLIAILLRDRPAVSLYCDVDNSVARKLYERVGFEEVYANRSYLLATR